MFYLATTVGTVVFNSGSLLLFSTDASLTVDVNASGVASTGALELLAVDMTSCTVAGGKSVGGLSV